MLFSGGDVVDYVGVSVWMWYVFIYIYYLVDFLFEDVGFFLYDRIVDDLYLFF